MALTISWKFELKISWTFNVCWNVVEICSKLRWNMVDCSTHRWNGVENTLKSRWKHVENPLKFNVEKSVERSTLNKLKNFFTFQRCSFNGFSTLIQRWTCLLGSGVTAGSWGALWQGVECPRHFSPGNFCWPTVKMRQGRKGKWKRKEGKSKRGSWRIENGRRKRYKMRRGPFHAGGKKNQEKWLCPLWKIFLLRPWAWCRVHAWMHTRSAF